MARPIEKRAHIERGVLEVVSKKGLAATTIQDIAQAAAVSPGLLYRYWRNRDDLAARVYAEHYNRLVERFEAELAPQRGFWPTLDALVGAFLAFAEQEPIILKFLLLSQHELVQHVPPERGIRKLLQQLVEAGQAAGEVRAMEPALALQFILGIAMQPVIGVFYGDLPGPATRYLGDINTMLQAALSPHGRTTRTHPAGRRAERDARERRG